MKAIGGWFILLVCLALAGCSDASSSRSKDKSGPNVATTSVRVEVAVGSTSSSALLSTFDQVSSVSIDVSEGATFLVQGQGLAYSGGTWSGVIDGLPVGPSLRFTGHAFDAESVEIFTGFVDQALSGSDDTVSLSLAQVGEVQVDLPRITQILSPAEVLAGSTAEIAVTVLAAPEINLSFAFSGSAGSFDPAQGDFTTGPDGSATIATTYTAPTEPDSYVLTVSVSNNNGSTVEGDFPISVVSAITGAPGVTVAFNPVITGLKGKRSGTDIEWTATVSDDGPPGELTYLWGLAGLSFVDVSTNPAVLQGYDETVMGTLSLSVTDRNGSGGSTSLSYALPSGLFPDNVIVQPIWRTRAAMPTARFGAAAALVGGRIYVVGGHSGTDALGTVEQYDPATNSWTNCNGGCAAMPTPRFAMSAAAVNGKIYVIGGLTGGGPVTGAVEEFNPATGQWTNCGEGCTSMPTARFAFGLSVVNGLIHVIGGHDGAGQLDAVEIFDPIGNEWAAGAPLPTARDQLTAAAVSGKIYAIGGIDTGESSLVEEYDPTADNWTNCGTGCGSMLSARKYSASAAVQGTIYVIGGGPGPMATVEAFDPVANPWTAKSSMPTAREQMALAVEPILNDIYVFGGWNGSQALNTVELYDPGADE